MAASSINSMQQPLIAIIGATGTGKSDLAVELALRYNGEIINADAIQMYEGLPILTNKIPVEERRNVPHHLLGSISLDEPSWTVQQFLPKTLQIIDDIRSRQKLPIVVGGTHYYTQALLFKDHTIESVEKDARSSGPSGHNHAILDEPTDIILEKLREVDPVMANRWHPNDRRKIQRSLQIFLDTGKRASEMYKQRLETESTSTSSLRFPTLLLWPFCEREAHKVRLDQRVDRMLETGLVDEVAQLMAIRDAKIEAGEEVDYTKGVWQAIGYKQFEPYQTAARSKKDLTKAQSLAVEQTQAATRRYASSQLKWIRIKLLNALVRADCHKCLFLLDGTDLSRWASSIVDPAIDLTAKFLQNEALPDPVTFGKHAAELLSPSKEDLTHSPESWGVQTCEVCGVKAATPQLWKMHLDSRGHRIKMTKRRAQEALALVDTDNTGSANG